MSVDHGDYTAGGPSGAVCPHNMILTTRWMGVLPRRWGAINKEAGVNSLGMLGVIAVAMTKESLAQPGVAKG